MLRGLGDVDHRKRYARSREALDAALDDVIARGDRVHRMAAAAASRVDRNIEHVDGGVVEVIVDHVLHAPAHRSLQLDRRYIGRLDQQELIVAGRQQRQASIVVDAQVLRDAVGILERSVKRARAATLDRALSRRLAHAVSKRQRSGLHGHCQPARLASAAPCEESSHYAQPSNLGFDFKL